MKLCKKIRKTISLVIAAAMSVSMMTSIPVSAEIGNKTYEYEDYSVNYSVTNEWDGAQTVEVTISNTGSSSILNWSLKYDAEGEVSGLWNAEIYKQGTDEYVIKNADWNYKIDPGQSVTYGYTLNGENCSMPDSFEFNSKRIEVIEGYTAQLNIKSEWDTGVEGEIILTNTSDAPIEAWTLSFDSNFTIINLWNAEITESSNGHYAVSSELWTNPIPSGGSVSIGFIGEKASEIDSSISNFSLISVVVDDKDDVVLPDLNTDVIDLGYIEDLIYADMIDVIQNQNGDIRTIDGKFTNKIVNSPEDAVWVLNAASSLFGSRFHADATNISVNQNGEEVFYRYTPIINGISVSGSQIIISTKNGEVTGLFSTYNNAIESITLAYQITSTEAIDVACDNLFFQYSELIDLLANNSGLSKEEVIDILYDSLKVNCSPEISFDWQDNPILTWVITLDNDYIFDDENENFYVDLEDIYDYGKYMLEGVHYEYYIYANGENAGNILYIDDGNDDVTWTATTAAALDYKGNSRNINVICNDVPDKYRMSDDVRKIETYETEYTALGTAKVPGNIVESTDNTWTTNPAAVSAHANMALVYDYYNNVLNWNSFDNKGSTIKMSLNYKKRPPNDWKNASWRPDIKQFCIGNKGNYYAAVDVLGHEFTHAVMTYKVGSMDKTGETGALKESYSDIMGNLVEGKTDNGRWTVAEDGLASLRDMSNPSINNYSNILKDANDDVHKNCEIFSYAAYKMMTDSRTSGISNNEWAKLFFNSMDRLAIDSNFLNARGAVIASARSLNFTKDEQQAIIDAFDAVGICEANTIRIVLRWGDKPSDLDSHLTGPAVSGANRFHVYFGSRHYFNDGTYNSTNALYAADLDYDDTSSYGPEITSIRKLTPGDYYFYVHDFSNRNSNASTALCNSNASVEIYKGLSKIPIVMANGHPARFTINYSGAATLWAVCKISVDSRGIVSITPINSFSNQSNPGFIGA